MRNIKKYKAKDQEKEKKYIGHNCCFLFVLEQAKRQWERRETKMGKLNEKRQWQTNKKNNLKKNCKERIKIKYEWKEKEQWQDNIKNKMKGEGERENIRKKK